MTTVDLYRVEMVRAMTIKSPQGDRVEDVVDIFHDMTHEQILALPAKYGSGASITRYCTKRGVAGKVRSQTKIGREYVAEPVTEAPRKPKGRRSASPAHKPAFVPVSGFGELVSVMGEKGVE